MLLAGLYTIVAGDTLHSLALTYDLEVEQIMEMNDIQNPNEIYIGDTLILIPDEVATETTTSAIETEATYFNDLDVTEADKKLLAQLVYNEANVEPMAGKIAVVDVVINRIFDAEFPDTIRGVVLEKGQFANSANLHKLPVTDENMQAVEDALKTPDTTNGALYFWAPALSDSEYMASLEVVKVIGSHEFLID